MMIISPDIIHTVLNAKKRNLNITVLTGAGISAESGIPTFRGPEGYWTIGSEEYHPQEMATFQMFNRNPAEVWKWYLYRMYVCRKAKPNKGHMALVELEMLLKQKFKLITQNIDNLHIQAGHSLPSIYQIHGNVFYARCASGCTDSIFPVPSGLENENKNEDLSDKKKNLLKCKKCGHMIRPHVLWFDETYNEKFYFFRTTIEIARVTDLLIIIGTSGSTNLPGQVAGIVYKRNKPIIDINIEENYFTQLASRSPGGGFIKASSSKALPRLIEYFR